MARIALVTIGTDGVVDYIQTPDGQRHMLGPVSVLKLVAGAVSSKRVARQVLEEFLENKQAMVSVDLDKMWELLPYKRARFSSINSLIRHDHHKPMESQDMTKTASYDTFASNMDLAEDIVAKVAATDAAIERLKTAGKRFDSVRAKSDLHQIATRVASIASEVDLAQPWVGNDLMELSKRATAIHQLFSPKEV